ncbi:integrase arm-type DNA-binding domain-containing protein [Methylorubrum extorquens]|uniref:tyrosine-type recombinase/integrase n=1 Tax=Methylorubrum extorquens TaxID=408 RepID=UPI002238098D|nr:site-specific integrase [Methylorubrum extorquens]UYW29047.1 integrase arm-type DNA-binding domain-containing protein [Methylorubrum extorquens]
MPSQSLTDAAVKAWAVPEAGRVEIADSRCRGLVLRITAKGDRSWSFRFRDTDGRTQRVTIGPYPEVGLSAARAKAEDHRARVAREGSTIGDRKAARLAVERRQAEEQAAIASAEAERLAAEQAVADVQAHAWETLAEQYLLRHAKPKKRSAGEDERMLQLHVTPRWAGRDFRTIKRSDCIRLIEQVGDTGKTALANRLCPLLSKLFKFAVDRGMLEASPAVALPRVAPNVVRDRVLSEDEVAMFWGATGDAAAFSPLVSLALRLIIVTGVRPGEVAGLHESELQDIDNPPRAVWYIPAERMKAKRPHAVPLTPLALSIIREAIQLTDDMGERRAAVSGVTPLAPGQRHVFTSPRGTPGGKAMDAHALAHAMARLGRVMTKPADGEPPAWMRGKAASTWLIDLPTPHDLRRTAATGMRGLGVSISDVQAVLGHSRQDVLGRHYDRHDAMPEKRRALTRWAGELERVVAGEADEKVVALRSSQVRA